MKEMVRTSPPTPTKAARRAAGGRGPKTVAYAIIERFKAAGLKPGNKGSWTAGTSRRSRSPRRTTAALTVTRAGQTPLFVAVLGKDYRRRITYREVR